MMKAVTTETLKEASEIIRAGKLVAFPTETVYGLGADATNGEAVARIFEAKGRPSFNPLIVHVAKAEDAARFVEVSDMARTLMNHFWPGPLTLILTLKMDSPISELCSAGLPTLAIRCPSHDAARKLIEGAGVPIAAPSANASGHLSPTSPQHVAKSLEGRVDMILAGGSTTAGLESTVVDLSTGTPTILRPGVITAEDLEPHIGKVDIATKDDGEIKSPGLLLKHYAPSIPVRLNAVDVGKGEALLAFGSIKFMGLKEGGAASTLPEEKFRNLSESGDLYEAASNLFAYLHALDNGDNKAIAVMNIPDQGVGIAINDRLRRAANS